MEKIKESKRTLLKLNILRCDEISVWFIIQNQEKQPYAFNL